jgi:hypothetical protein
MNNDYTVSITKTSHFNLEYKQLAIAYELSTWDEACEKYKECVADESMHVSTLNSVRSNVTITMAHKDSIQYRVNIYN